MKSIARKINLWAKKRLFYWLWPVIQEDIVQHPGVWSGALQTGVRTQKTLISGVKL